jgi:hypothetical protein
MPGTRGPDEGFYPFLKTVPFGDLAAYSEAGDFTLQLE